MNSKTKKPKNDDKNNNVNDDESNIQKFFVGKTVFLTGSTGFLGQCIVEKLLRSCPDLKKMYMLVRPKRGMSVSERVEKYFNLETFDLLREKSPNFMEKIVLVEGDLTEENFGLTDSIRNTLLEETEIMIHNAATVKFHEKPSLALKINVLGTKKMLDLANQCKKLNCFTYVSTAYSNCHNMEIEEKFYSAPADLKMVKDMIEADLATEGLSEASLKMLIEPFPNIYTFTKATAESLVKNYCANAKFAALVFRPSIVISTVREPIPGWCGKLNGPMLAYAATTAGIIHSMWYKGNPIDFVPVDMSVNGLLAAIWDTTENRNSKEALVYNYASSTVQPITLKRLNVVIEPIRNATPTKKMVWAFFVLFINNYYIWQFSNIFLHLIPAILVDLILAVQGIKTFVVSSYFKVNKYCNAIFYFWNREWKISVKEMSKTWDRMSPVDRELFYCDLRDLDWSEWATNFWPGLRVHSLKDPLDTIPAAKIKQRKLKIVNYVLMGILMLLLCYGLQKLLRSIINTFY